MCRTKKKRILWFFLVFSLCLCSCKKQGTEIILDDVGQENQENLPKEEVQEKPKEAAEQEILTEPTSIWVDVSGAVAKPGVYELPENARVFEAIEAAGGFLEQADEQWLNQATTLTDGEKIQVYTKEETEAFKAQGMTSEEAPARQESAAPKEEAKGKVNLNTATLEGLQEIPGIGEVRAQAILEYRQQAGGFKSVEEIQEVPGIKGKTYEKIADYICVD